MTDLSEHIVKEIEVRGMVPRPRWHFLFKRSVFWSLAFASVLIGAVAFAVAEYVFFDNEGAGAATILESPIEDVLASIPFIWLFVLGLFTASAYVSLRHTKKGYRYRTIRAVLMVVGASIVLGLILNTLDFGQMVHGYLLSHTDFYDVLIHSRDDIGP